MKLESFLGVCNHVLGFVNGGKKWIRMIFFVCLLSVD